MPVQVLVPDQALPVYYTLRAQLTHGEVTFSQTAIDEELLSLGGLADPTRRR